MNKKHNKTGRSPAPSKHSMGWQILFWMSLVAMGPLLIMAYQGYHCARQAVVESQEKHLKSVLESRKIMLEAWLAKIKTNLYFLSLTPCSGKMCNLPADGSIPVHAKNCCKLLDSVQEGSTYYKTIASYTADWKPHYQGRGPDIQNLLSAEFKTKLAEAKGLVIAPAIINGNILAGYPVVTQEDSEVAYIIACLDLTQSITPILSNRTGLGNSGKVYLLSSDGHYLSLPPGSSNRQGQENHLPPQIFSQESPTVLEYEDFRGVDVLGVADKIQELNWTVVAEMDYAEAFAWLGTLRHRAFVTGAITLIVVLFVSIRSARKLSQPLKKLAAVSRRIALGHPEERLGPLDGAEAQEVGQAFDKMMDQLSASHRKLMQTASLAAVGELSSSIVHEMRNPLSSVKINLQALRKKVEGDANYAELADIASEQVVRLEKMLADLLNYGKPLHLATTRISFGDLAKEILELVRQQATEKAVSVTIENELDQTPITADPEQTRRALTNLVANAIQAAPHGGAVRISAKTIESNRAIISVCDNGRGISETEKEKLFQPFFTTKEGGTGLGLANVKKIADYHGWNIAAENLPEGGAVFTISLTI